MDELVVPLRYFWGPCEVLNNTINYLNCINLLVTCDHYTDTHPNYNKPRDPRIESDEVMPPGPISDSVNKH